MILILLICRYIYFSHVIVFVDPAFIPIAASEWVPGHPLLRQLPAKHDCVVVNHRMLYESVDCDSSFAMICAMSISKKVELNNLGKWLVPQRSVVAPSTSKLRNWFFWLQFCHKGIRKSNWWSTQLPLSKGSWQITWKSIEVKPIWCSNVKLLIADPGNWFIRG